MACIYCWLQTKYLQSHYKIIFSNALHNMPHFTPYLAFIYVILIVFNVVVCEETCPKFTKICMWKGISRSRYRPKANVLTHLNLYHSSLQFVAHTLCKFGKIMAKMSNWISCTSLGQGARLGGSQILQIPQKRLSHTGQLSTFFSIFWTSKTKKYSNS